MATLTIYANIDAYIDAQSPTVNYGSAVNCQTGAYYIGESKSDWFRSVGNFDVSALALATVNSAKMLRNVSLVFPELEGGYAAHVSRCIYPDGWVESEMTWDERLTGTDWDSGGGDYDDAGPPAKIDYNEATGLGEHEIIGLADMVDDAIDSRGGILSVIMRLSDEDPGTNLGIAWRSREYGTEAERWRIEVDYTGELITENRRRVGAQVI